MLFALAENFLNCYRHRHLTINNIYDKIDIQDRSKGGARMKNMSQAVKSSLKYGLFTEADLKQTENLICEKYAVFPTDLGVCSSWVEFHSMKTHRMAVLLHKKYRLAFVLSELEFNTPAFHIEYTDSFDADEWYIDDIDIFNNDFPYLKWHEPESIIDPHRFDLMDLRFATE